MKYVVGVLLGLLSGFLIYMGTAMLFVDTTSEGPSGLFIAVTFIGGWIISSFLLIRGAKSVSKVFSRGFLLGAAEWLALIPIGLVMAGRAATTAIGPAATEAEQAGAAFAGGLISIVTGGVAVVMAVICLLGFAVSYFIGREMKPEEERPSKRCPDCAELVKAEAKKCRFCGADLVPETGTATA